MTKHEASISSLWRQLEFVCGGEHDGTPKLEPEMKGLQVVYRCPICGQTTAYYDIEKFMDKITKIIVDDAEDGCATNLTNYKMTLISRYDRKQHTFKVLSHTPTKMKVSLNNG